MNESSVKYLLIQRGSQVLQIVEEMERYLDDKHDGRWRVKLPSIDDFATPIDPGYIDTTYEGEEAYAGNQAEAPGSEESEVASLKHRCGNASAFNDGTADSGYTSVYDKDLPKENNASDKQEQNEDNEDQTSAHRGANNRAS